jgi:chromosome segregation ATPase
MEHDEAFWLVVDVANLERLLAEAEAAAAGVDGKIEKAEAHLAEAKAAKKRALDEVARLRSALDDAAAKAEEIPAELADAVTAEVTAKNRVRDAVVLISALPPDALVRVMAEAAEGTGEANGAN